MSDEYTPTDDEVRKAYLDGRYLNEGMEGRREQRRAAFDRWLSTRLAQAKTEALKPVHDALYQGGQDVESVRRRLMELVPYRSEAGR